MAMNPVGWQSKYCAKALSWSSERQWKCFEKGTILPGHL